MFPGSPGQAGSRKSGGDGAAEKEQVMRLDKYLKVSRIIKRRTVANEACDSGRVMLNDKIARASAEVKVGDVIEVAFGTKAVKVRVTSVQETIRKRKIRRKCLNIFRKNLTVKTDEVFYVRCEFPLWQV